MFHITQKCMVKSGMINHQCCVWVCYVQLHHKAAACRYHCETKHGDWSNGLLYRASYRPSHGNRVTPWWCLCVCATMILFVSVNGLSTAVARLQGRPSTPYCDCILNTLLASIGSMLNLKRHHAVLYNNFCVPSATKQWLSNPYTDVCLYVCACL